MGYTAAALALGACVFGKIDVESAALYKNKAIAIYDRAKKSDTQVSAFERDATNDFYYDRKDADNMALAASELYRLTRNKKYLDDGKIYAPPVTYRVYWGEMNAFANYRLAEHGDTAAKDRFFLETSRYKFNNIWNLPAKRYGWGSLPVWIGMANACFLAWRLDKKKDFPDPFIGVLDYAFGCNNWGIAMLASEDLPCSIRNIYSFVWHVLKTLPVGALSEGPADRETHDLLKRFFKTPVNSPLEQFNTSACVFYDDAYDFMIQESTIWGQGTFILMLALASV